MLATNLGRPDGRANVTPANAPLSVERAVFGAQDAARYLSISRAGFWRLLRDGKIQKVRIGGRTLVRRVDLDAYIDRCVEAV